MTRVTFGAAGVSMFVLFLGVAGDVVLMLLPRL
jgi:hypothetical protein